MVIWCVTGNVVVGGGNVTRRLGNVTGDVTGSVTGDGNVTGNIKLSNEGF